jgi:hypothetical protein
MTEGDVQSVMMCVHHHALGAVFLKPEQRFEVGTKLSLEEMGMNPFAKHTLCNKMFKHLSTISVKMFLNRCY